MYTLMLFYVLSSQFHTDVSSIQTLYANEGMCKVGATVTIETLKRAHPDVSKIEWACIQTGLPN